MSNPTSIYGTKLKEMFIAGGKWLRVHMAHVNSLNVFPVPDGDTGTNMFLTLQASMKNMQAASSNHAGEVAAQASQGALMGARGNSGVILSQILDGFAVSLDGKESFTLPDFANALQSASDKAYGAVAEPVEGTILTVIKESARAGQEALPTSESFDQLLSSVLETAETTLKLTPELLPILKEAGVVDSGGAGLVYFFEGMHRLLNGLPVESDEQNDDIITAELIPGSIEDEFTPGYGYDVQFLINGQNLDIDAIRQSIIGMGECPLVVGNAQTVKVHVHVPDPGVPISYGITQGFLMDVVVENMEQQYHEFFEQKEKVAVQTAVETATICVSPGPGLSEVFESLGATIIINGGQTMNPSTQELVEAIEHAPSEQVLILPNNSNIVLTAQQASSMAKKDVRVVGTKTIPQGISALLAFNPETDLETNVTRMCNTSAHVQTIEITEAVRTTTINDIQVQEGDIIGLLNDSLVATGQDQHRVCLDVLANLDTDELEILTVYFGEDSTSETADTLAEEIAQVYPHLEVETISGGQPHYHYIISLE